MFHSLVLKVGEVPHYYCKGAGEGSCDVPR